MNIDILDRLAAANPASEDVPRPNVLLPKTALRDVIQTKHELRQVDDLIEGTPSRSGRRRNLLVALAAFAIGVIVGVSSMLVAGSGGRDNPASFIAGPGQPGEASTSGSDNGVFSSQELGVRRLGLEEIMALYGSSAEGPLIDLSAAGCDQRSPFGGTTADGSGFWVRDCGEGKTALWVLEFEDGRRLVTPAVARSDRPTFGFLEDGTLLILGLNISISDDFDVTVGSPTLWEYVSDDQWVSHPVDAVFPDRDHVQADVLSDPEAYPDDSVDRVIRDFGGAFLEDYEITRSDGRLSITGIDLTLDEDGKTVRPGRSGGRTITWLEDDTGTLRPVGR